MSHHHDATFNSFISYHINTIITQICLFDHIVQTSTVRISGADSHYAKDSKNTHANTPAAVTGEPVVLQPESCVFVVTSTHCSGPSHNPELPKWSSSL